MMFSRFPLRCALRDRGPVDSYHPGRSLSARRGLPLKWVSANNPGRSTGAGAFLLRGQEKGTKEKAAPVHRHFVVSLCCSPRKAAVELALVKRTRRGLRQSSPTTPSSAATARRFSGELQNQTPPH